MKYEISSAPEFAPIFYYRDKTRVQVVYLLSIKRKHALFRQAYAIYLRNRTYPWGLMVL